MGAMELDAVEPGLLGPAGGGDEVADHRLDLGGRHRPGARALVVRRGHRRRTGQLLRGSTARVLELDEAHCAGSAKVVGESLEAGQVAVVVGAELPREAQPARRHRRCTGHHRAEAAVAPHRQPSVLVVGQGAIRVALGVGERGQHQRVGGCPAAGEGEGSEEVGHALTMQDRSVVCRAGP